VFVGSVGLSSFISGIQIYAEREGFEYCTHPNSLSEIAYQI